MSGRATQARPPQNTIQGDPVRVLSGLSVVALVALAATADAQQPGSFGIGVALTRDVFLGGGEDSPPLTSITFPMNLGAFRLEPEFALSHAGFKQSDPFFGDIDLSTTSILIGTGAYMMNGPNDDFIFYGGPRVGIIRNSQSDAATDPEQKLSSTDMFLGLALGGEHLFSKHLSLGAEARLTYYRAGKLKVEPDPGAEDNSKASATLTSGVAMVRVYF
jgi:hypothetical protein